ncbi:hypothetical protein LINGRAPRIM_LOCUS2162 [Linum grandiflorum]
MLALTSRPNSSVAQVLKGRYYPYGTLLTTSKGSCPFWGLSSVLHGRDLLLQGSRWMVGNYMTISTMLDN